MLIMKNLFSRALLAFALATSAGATMAVPTAYHVNVDTTSLAGTGLLDLSFIGLGTPDSATAVLSNFTGSYGAVYDSFGAISGDVSTSVALGNVAAANYLTQVVNFGGLFGFDILFDFEEADIGTRFALNMYLPELSDFAFGEGSLVEVDLNPAGTIELFAKTPFASITAITAEVPEPGQWLLMATGLLLLGATVRRRSL